MVEEKDCFGDMKIGGSTPCKSCDFVNKIKCFNETMANKFNVPKECLENEQRIKCVSLGKPCKNNLPYEFEEACKFLGDLAQKRKEGCVNFGTLNIHFNPNNIRMCSSCPEEEYIACEAAETNLRKFPNLKKESVVRREILEEIIEMFEEGSCFGHFEFDKRDCLNECEFKVACLRKTGIIAPPEFDESTMPNIPTKCAYFPTLKEIEEIFKRGSRKDIFDKLSPNKCFQCPLLKDCRLFAEKITEWLEKIEDNKKVFKNFFPLRTIRKELMSIEQKL